MMNQPMRQYPVEGTFDVDLSKFPKEVVEGAMIGKGIPPLTITIPAAFLQDGATMTADSSGIRVSFTFAAFEAIITEAKS